MVIIPRKLLGDAREQLKTLPDNSIHLCVSSPPYWGLRSYLPKDHPLKPLEIGTEPTLQGYIDHLLEVYAQVWRVLREDGTCWINLGDCYCGSWENAGSRPELDAKTHNQRSKQTEYFARGGWDCRRDVPPNQKVDGLKPKDLCMVPFRVALALQAQGWYLRSIIPWLKRNAMPESVEDRPSTATEYVLMLSKGERYYYDRHTVAFKARTMPHNSGYKDGHEYAVGPMNRGGHSQREDPERVWAATGNRNRRNSDWFFESWQGLWCNEDGDPLALIVNPVGTKIKHFASYPPKLIEPIIKAGTSEKGCCPNCGAQWVRRVESSPMEIRRSGRGQAIFGNGHSTASSGTVVKPAEFTTTGWKPTCNCGVATTIPATVLDPFWGTGCTGMVASRLGRASIGCELNPVYFKDSDARDGQAVMALT